MTKINKVTQKTTAEELFQEMPAVKVATHSHADSELKRREGDKKSEQENGQKFFNALRDVYGKPNVEYKHRTKPLYISNNVKGIIRGEWIERYKAKAATTVLPATISTYAGAVMSYLEENYPIEFTPTGEAKTQAEKDRDEAKAIKNRGISAVKKEASDISSGITKQIGEIRDLANELVTRGNKKVRSPSAKDALVKLKQIETTVSSKLEKLLK